MQYDHSKNRVEHPDPIKAEVKGTLPSWLQGTLLRNGPGMFSVGDTSYKHWFDGMALMHSFTFKNGEGKLRTCLLLSLDRDHYSDRLLTGVPITDSAVANKHTGDVIYRSRYLCGDTYKSNTEAKRIVVSEMGTMAYPDPSKSIFTKVITFLSHTIPDFTDNCGNNIIRYGKDYYATSETNYIRKIDPETLETLDKVDYLKYLAVNLVTSHPHYDKEGNTFNMGTTIAEKGKTKYTIFKVPSAAEGSTQETPALKNLEVISTIPCRSLLTPSYYHSFGMTDNYFIFIEQPFKLDILKMATAYMRGVNWASCLKFHPEDNTLIHLIDRKTGKQVETKFFTDSMVVYHHVNAFEEDGHVVFDVIAYNDNSLYDMFYLSKIKEDSEENRKAYSRPKCKRFVLPVQTHAAPIGEDLVKLKFTTASAVKEKEGKINCQPEILCEGVELPRINYNFNGKKHGYVYWTSAEMSPVSSKIMKFEVATRKSVEWTEENCLVCEPVFIGNPMAIEEDDGVVLASVICTDPEKSNFLLVLDGRSFTEIARAYVDADLHIDMHGHFIPQYN